MRVDHFAYQRAARVAALGLVLQVVIGLILLIFGLLAKDTVITHSCLFVLPGALIWTSLWVLFQQHKMAALEDLEIDEIAARRSRTGSAFDQDEDELRVAGRRLRLMHKWLMPIISVSLAVVLGILAYIVLRYYGRLADPTQPTEFNVSAHRGWAVAICLSFALVAFIFSRFVAGMAKQTAWQNLRGGAAYMVGSALLMLVVSVGIVFRFFENEAVNEVIGKAIPWYMLLIAAEILLNFVLNIYRPRVAGEIPRPAFDSKLLSLLSTPDNIVRSLNEAVNYQFGFDITSSWGYQLLLRSFIWLVGFAVVILLLLSTMVVVEPHQQAVRLRHGEIVEVFREPGLKWKLPWPFERAEVYDVRRVRELPLTAELAPRPPDSVPRLEINLWTSELKTIGDLDPFVVGSAQSWTSPEGVESPASDMDEDGEPVDEVTTRLSSSYSLVDAILVMKYRIRDIEEFLRFSSSERRGREQVTTRERALRDMALRAATQKMSRTPYDEALSRGRVQMLDELRRMIQDEFDARGTGVEVVLVEAPVIRPPSETASKYEELFNSRVHRQSMLEEARTTQDATMVTTVGDLAEAERIVEAIDKLVEISENAPADSPEVVAQRQHLRELLLDAGGQAANMMQAAEEARWKRVMDERERSLKTGGDVLSFQASPRLYKYRATMKMLQDVMRNVPKFILAVEHPERVKIDASFIDQNPLFDAQQAITTEENQ